MRSEMKKKEEVGRSVKTIQKEFGEAPMTLEKRRTVALERIADSANALVNLILLCLHKHLRYILFTKVMWTALSIVAAIALVTAANKTT